MARNLNNLNILFALMRLVRSLLQNPHIHIELYVSTVLFQLSLHLNFHQIRMIISFYDNADEVARLIIGMLYICLLNFSF